MTGFRNKKRVNPFVQIDKSMLSDTNISWKAKGILAYLLSKPDDWVTYAKDIENQSTDGRESVANGIKELIAAGYMERRRVRERGQFKGYEYSVYEYPEAVGNTENGFPVNGKSENGFSVNDKTENGKTATTNKDLSNKDLSNNDLTNINNNDACASAFSFYEKNGFGILTPHVGEKMGAWIDDLNEEIVLHALKISVENSVPRWNYAESILKDWSNKKLLSVSQVEAFEAKRKQEQSTKGVRHRSGKEKNIVPEWFKKDKEPEFSSTEHTVDFDIESRRLELAERLRKLNA